MRTLAIFALLSLAALGQQAQIPAMQIQLPGVVEPQQTITISIPKNGGKVTFTIPQQTLLKPSQTATPATTAPVTLGSYTFQITLTADQMNALKAGHDVTNVQVTLKAVK